MRSILGGRVAIATTCAVTSMLYGSFAKANYLYCGTDVLENRIKWSSPSITMKAFPSGFSVGGTPTNYFNRISETAGTWNALSGSNVSFSVVMDDENIDQDTGPGTVGENQIYRVDGAHPLDYAMVTLTTMATSCEALCCPDGPAEIVEADIEVYSHLLNGSSIPWSDAKAAGAVLNTANISSNPCVLCNFHAARARTCSGIEA